MIEEKREDHIVANRLIILIPVGIAVIGVEKVKWDLVSKSEPTINVWWPQTIHPIKLIINKAISIPSLLNILYWLNLGIISLIIPKAGEIRICASGCLGNQSECWGNNKSPPRVGSKKEQLKCRSKITIRITPANTGILIIDNKLVENIDQQYNGKNRSELIIEGLLDFNKLIIKLIDPNKLLNPIICKEENMGSIGG